MTTSYRRASGLVTLVATAAVALSACGASSSPHVASLGKNSGGSSTTTRIDASSATALPKGKPTKLVDEWAICMRRHGDPSQPDPTIDANKLIHIAWNPAIPGGYNGTYKGGQGNVGPGQFCRAYLTAATNALQGGQTEKPPSHAAVEKYSECMRANGIPDFPDPTANGLVISIHPGSDLDPSNPAFQRAAKLCAQKTGVRAFVGTPQPGTIELNGGGPP